MAQPDKYTINYDFSDYQSSNPTDPLPGDRIDTELAEIKSTTDAIIDNLVLIQRDDGALANGVVGVDQVATGLAATMAASGNPRGPWTSATSYAAADCVTSAGVTYICVVAHTSGTFATDLAADKWMPIGGSAGGTVFTSAGNISSTNVQSAIEELDAEKQPLDSTLTILAGVNPSAAQMHWWPTVSSASAVDVTSAALTVLDDATVSAMRTTLGAGAVGDLVFAASAASAARSALGATAVGETLFTAADAGTAFTAIKQDATSAATGVGRLATQAEAEAGTESAAVLMTPLRVAQALSAASTTSDLVKITTATLNNTATAQTFTQDNTTYRAFLYVFEKVVLATDNVNLLLRTSTDGGSSYDSGASDYQYTNLKTDVTGDGTGTTSTDADSANSSIILASNLGSDTGEGMSGNLWVPGAGLSTIYTMVHGQFSEIGNNGLLRNFQVTGCRNSAADVDAVQVVTSSGNLESGRVTQYGLK